MSAPFTEGPWFFDLTLAAVGPRDGTVCVGIGWSPDGQLIAAAPDMYAALKQAESEMQAGFGSSFGETREQIRRALAKAEGRA